MVVKVCWLTPSEEDVSGVILVDDMDSFWLSSPVDTLGVEVSSELVLIESGTLVGISFSDWSGATDVESLRVEISAPEDMEDTEAMEVTENNDEPVVSGARVAVVLRDFSGMVAVLESSVGPPTFVTCVA